MKNILKMLTVLICFQVLIGNACKTEKKCKYKPSPIFQAGLPHITQYNYEQNGSQSLESLMLDTGILLEIGQDICTETKQEYRFMVKGNYTQYPDSLWVKEAVRQLVFLSTISPAQLGLKGWADALEANRNQIALGADIEMQENIFVRVDRISSPDQSTLILLFQQQ